MRYFITYWISYHLLDFDVDGFGAFFGEEHAQLVKGCTPFAIRHAFCEHLYSFLLNGISSISMVGDVLNIMRLSGNNLCIVMGSNPSFSLSKMCYNFHDLDLITFHTSTKL